MRIPAIALVAAMAPICSSCVGVAPSPFDNVGSFFIAPDVDVITVDAGASLPVTAVLDEPVRTMTWAWDPDALGVADFECEPRQSCAVTGIAEQGAQATATIVCGGTRSVRARVAGIRPGRTIMRLEVFGRGPCVMPSGPVTCGPNNFRSVPIDVNPRSKAP